MNEHTFVVSGVRCGVQGQHACGVPEAIGVLDFMRPNSIDHLIHSFINFQGYISESSGLKLRLAMRFMQLLFPKYCVLNANIKMHYFVIWQHCNSLCQVWLISKLLPVCQCHCKVKM